MENSIGLLCLYLLLSVSDNSPALIIARERIIHIKVFGKTGVQTFNSSIAVCSSQITNYLFAYARSQDQPKIFVWRSGQCKPRSGTDKSRSGAD